MTTRRGTAAPPLPRALLTLLAAGVLGLTACTGTPEATATPTGTATATASATPTVTAPASPSPTGTSTATSSPSSPSPTATPGAGPSPTNVRLDGRLPDLSVPVPPGEGEAGRLTILWDGAPDATGFQVYVKDCDGSVRPAIEVPATDHRYGPIHACRPSGNLGVAAIYPGGESSIAWAR